MARRAFCGCPRRGPGLPEKLFNKEFKQKVFGGVGTFFQKGSDPPEAR
jgi:hypothetical protein